MLSSMIVATDKAAIAPLAQVLESEGPATVLWNPSAAMALAAMEHTRIDLCVIGETLTDMTGQEFARRLIKQYPMCNCALVSGLAPQDFHEATEGLGLLPQLVPPVDGESSRTLLRHLRQIIGI